ncbi:TetR/AcrR family transcriptional regulator [Streptococcus ruminicola]|uniref:TetR/AcrR family transcriptional regulator n=1 Tax=Streptococcus ruminicola TaxID=2686210 RepID=UPI0012F787C9|nr:TetR/AcrR family transcriptional regulator [Streptococcus ruminicola]QGX00979.1 TetR family transcriptional regulator [Streptococcus ruminicola]
MTNIRKTNSVEKLKNALIELLLEKDYSEISVSDITKKAGVSRGTFYQHFLDKDDLATTISDETSERFWNILSKGNLDKPDKILESLKCIKDDAKHFKVISQAPHVEFSKTVRVLLERLVTTNVNLKNRIKQKSKITDDLIIEAFCASFESIISAWIESDFKKSPEEISDIIVKLEELFFHSLTPPTHWYHQLL